MPEQQQNFPAPAVAALQRRNAARVPLDPPRGLFGRILQWYSRRSYGQVAEPALAMAHDRRALVAYGMFERRVAKFRALDPELKALAQLAAAARIGCSWCLDFGYWISVAQDGVDPAVLAEVPRWRESTLLSPLQRRVVAYADGATATPPEIDDALVADLRAELGVPAFVELTMMIAVENLRSRFNTALGLQSQGFAQACEVPAR
jgi:alkylhydroperoxidase family enzyme